MQAVLQYLRHTTNTINWSRSAGLPVYLALIIVWCCQNRSVTILPSPSCWALAVLPPKGSNTDYSVGSCHRMDCTIFWSPYLNFEVHLLVWEWRFSKMWSWGTIWFEWSLGAFSWTIISPIGYVPTERKVQNFIKPREWRGRVPGIHRTNTGQPGGTFTMKYITGLCRWREADGVAYCCPGNQCRRDHVSGQAEDRCHIWTIGREQGWRQL